MSRLLLWRSDLRNQRQRVQFFPMFEMERRALRQVFKLPRPTMGQSLLLASIYAAQAVFCTAVLTLGYTWKHAPGMGWAIISAILVLQPGLEASLAASISRICANIVGATLALAIEHWFGVGLWQLLIGIVVIVFLCELLRLDMGLRAACVSIVIVMTFRDSRIVLTSLDRSISVIIGSMLAVIVQIGGSRVKSIIFGHHDAKPA